jgi:hypothetical protein
LKVEMKICKGNEGGDKNQNEEEDENEDEDERRK